MNIFQFDNKEHEYLEYTCICSRLSHKIFIDCQHLLKLLYANQDVVKYIYLSSRCCGLFVFKSLLTHLENINCVFIFDSISKFVNTYGVHKTKYSTQYSTFVLQPHLYNGYVFVDHQQECIIQIGSKSNFKLKYFDSDLFSVNYTYTLEYLTQYVVPKLFHQNDIISFLYNGDVQTLIKSVETCKEIVSKFPKELSSKSCIQDSHLGLLKYYCYTFYGFFKMILTNLKTEDSNIVLQLFPNGEITFLNIGFTGDDMSDVYENIHFLFTQIQRKSMQGYSVPNRELQYTLVPGCSFVIDDVTMAEFSGKGMPVYSVSDEWPKMIRCLQSTRIDVTICCHLLLLFEYFIGRESTESEYLKCLLDTSIQIEYINILTKNRKEFDLFLSDKPSNLIEFQIGWLTGKPFDENLLVYGHRLGAKMYPDFPSNQVFAKLIEETEHFENFKLLTSTIRDRKIRTEMIKKFVAKELSERNEIQHLYRHLDFYGIFSNQQKNLKAKLTLLLVETLFQNTTNILSKSCKFKSKFS